MSTPFSNPSQLNPDAGITSAPSIGQAANDLRHAAGEKARELVHTAEVKAAELKDRAAENSRHLREVAAEKAQALKESASEKAQHLKESASVQWEDTRHKARELQITAEDYIRQNPTQCVLGALGIGFLVGLIVRR